MEDIVKRVALLLRNQSAIVQKLFLISFVFFQKLFFFFYLHEHDQLFKYEHQRNSR